MFAFDDLSLRSVPVTIRGEAYVLTEISEEDHGTYQGEMMAAVKTSDDGGKPKIESLRDLGHLDRFLLSLCLTRGGQRVSAEEIKGWPRRIVSPLVDKVKEMSEMNKKDEDVAKNESGATSDASS